jgi:hypothetical protein
MSRYVAVLVFGVFAVAVVPKLNAWGAAQRQRDGQPYADPGLDEPTE